MRDGTKYEKQNVAVCKLGDRSNVSRLFFVHRPSPPSSRLDPIHPLPRRPQRRDVRIAPKKRLQRVLQGLEALVPPLRQLLQRDPLPALALVRFHVRQRGGAGRELGAGDERDVVLGLGVEHVLRDADWLELEGGG